jgi:hypothetical protein
MEKFIIICQSCNLFFLDSPTDVRWTQSWSSSSQSGMRPGGTPNGFLGTRSFRRASPAPWAELQKEKSSGVVKALIGHCGYFLARAQQVCRPVYPYSNVQFGWSPQADPSMMLSSANLSNHTDLNLVDQLCTGLAACCCKQRKNS